MAELKNAGYLVHGHAVVVGSTNGGVAILTEILREAL